MHVVISTRADPALPLARLRARGELVEVRAADLRFTGAEAAAYLNDVNTLGLEPHDVAALETRTEGWAAALQLAALSLQGRDDRSQFIAGFAGDDRFVVDYLADEVLDRQPRGRTPLPAGHLGPRPTERPAVRRGHRGRRAEADAGALERQNLFVIPLDAHRRWYRYHHLFADVLHARLLDERPGDVAELHRRASDWYDRSGDPEAAVRHALAAGDVDLAADQVELAIPDLRRRRREAVICRWVDELPADIVRNRPVLAVGFVGALAAEQRFDGLERRLQDVEQLLDGPVDDHVVADERELARLPAAVGTYRAALALVGGDLAGTGPARPSRAGPRRRRATTSHRGSASALLGPRLLGRRGPGRGTRGYRAAAEALARAGHVADVLGLRHHPRRHRDDPGQAAGRPADLSTPSNWPPATPRPLRGTADMYVGLAGWPGNAATSPGRPTTCGGPTSSESAAGLPQNPYRWRVAMAHLRAAEGDTAAAAACSTRPSGSTSATSPPTCGR